MKYLNNRSQLSRNEEEHRHALTSFHAAVVVEFPQKHLGIPWSTAYFRCLSLNVPPPVKPRLEYPIPRDYCGVTPGWLKALLYQLQNNASVPFKVLWDRWTGACLQHDTLIQILCLGGFDDPEAIPWSRFVGLCAAHLTDDLTHSMILICEIMTEEPDGGSAMVPLETFLDLYKFLAGIDASRPQKLENRYFRDSLLDLWREKTEKVEATKEIKEESVYEEESVKSLESVKSEPEEVMKEPSKEEISCPSIGPDDYSMDYYLEAIASEPEEQQEFQQEYIPIGDTNIYLEGEDQVDETLPEPEEEEKDVKSDESEPKEEEREEEGDEAGSKKASEDGQEIGDGIALQGEEPGEREEIKDDGEQIDVKEYESVETIVEEPRQILPEVDEEGGLYEDLLKLKSLQQEVPGEADEEVEKYKCQLIQQMSVEEDQPDLSPYVGAAAQDEITEKESVQEVPAPVEKPEEEKYEEVYVPRIPGIGAVVPEDLVKAVCDYMKRVAAIQHGMVMPRNIRHYNCPPLEAMEY